MDLDHIGFVDDGGGCTGVINVGHKKAARAAGIKTPICEQGISVGALNGSTEDVDELIDLWRWVERHGPGVIFPWWEPPLRFLFRKNSLYSDRGLKRLLDFIDFNKLVRSPRRFDVVAFNENTQKQVIFSTSDSEVQSCPEMMRPRIKSSASLEGVLPPVEINGEWYSDGSAFMLKPMIQAGCRTIFIFLNDVAGHSPVGPQSSARERLFAGFTQGHMLLNEREIGYAEDINNILNALKMCDKYLRHLNLVQRWVMGSTLKHFHLLFEGKFSVDIVVFRPIKPIPSLWTLGFQKGSFDQAIAHTYEIDMRIYEEIVFRS